MDHELGAAEARHAASMETGHGSKARTGPWTRCSGDAVAGDIVVAIDGVTA